MAEATAAKSGIAHWAPLIAVSLAMFIVVLDSTMMNVAVGAIAKDLNTGISSVQGAISIYSLVMASLMLTGGKLGDLHGAKRITQQLLGFSAVQTGLSILPFSIGVFVLSMTTANLAERIAPKWLINGGIVYAIGVLWMWAVTSAEMTIWDMVLPMFVMGVGIGLFVAQIVNLTISQVGDDERNEGAGTHNTFRELGGALGTAVVGSVLLVGIFTGFVDGALRADNIEASPEERDRLAVILEDEVNAITAEDGEALVETLGAAEQQQLDQLVADAYVGAQKNALLVIAGLMLVALGAGSFLPGRRRETERLPPGEKAVLR